MDSWLGPLLAIAGVAAAVVALVFIGFFHESGRQRLLPLLRPLMKGVINPRTLRAVAHGESSYAVVHHVGRRSGKSYQTPVEAYRTADGALILLPYGPVTDWCRNVLAAGQCTVTLEGEDLALNAPEAVPASVAEAWVPADVGRRWHRQGIAHYLWLKSVPPTEFEAEPTLASTTSGSSGADDGRARAER
jgi:deazaflavin-dependent oxidoreductase (nitroreductase family)